MTLLVPFDNTPLSRAALEKATAFGDYRDESVLALTVIPDDVDYALERGWLYDHEAFDTDTIADRLEERVASISPAASFRSTVVNSDEPTATTTTMVVSEIRRTAAEEGVSVIFVGTENAGGVTTPLSSVGGPVATDSQSKYDVYIVRHAE
ncbi:universal stress protein [Halobacteria archaeon AArc-curdl1]|uniref:Universal stress protein n=1 Tax=Natronosalvus hydrolyticus TaxID=2979988 RepID=A0AAP2Z7Y1_9EURY|nr:universal stress protein [Halobacteria archaeon AArc-curdl1]